MDAPTAAAAAAHSGAGCGGSEGADGAECADALQLLPPGAADAVGMEIDYNTLFEETLNAQAG
jgi:hypothetical protein